MEVGRLQHEAGVGGALEDGEEGEGEEELGEVVHLEVGVEAVGGGFVVFPYALAGVADELGVEECVSVYAFVFKRVACFGRVRSYGIDLLLARQLFCHFICLL